MTKQMWYLSAFWKKLHYFCKQQTNHNDQIKSLASFKLTWQASILCLVCYRREFWEKTITWMVKWFVRGALIFMYISHINARNRMDAGVCCAHCVWYDRDSPQLSDTNDIFTLLSVHFCVRVCFCVYVLGLWQAESTWELRRVSMQQIKTDLFHFHTSITTDGFRKTGTPTCMISHTLQTSRPYPTCLKYTQAIIIFHTSLGVKHYQ